MVTEDRLEYNSNMQTRILYLGMQGPFSCLPLKALVESGHKPVGLAAPPPPGVSKPFRRLTYPLPESTAMGDNIFILAAQAGIPIFEIGDLRHADTHLWLQNLNLDLIIVACFDRLLPPAWLDAPRLGCINLHPSLLPAYRGPNPIEDQLKNGEKSTGITLHFMDEGADTGDIISQQVLPIPENCTVEQLERQAAETGANILRKILENPDSIPRRPQSGG